MPALFGHQYTRQELLRRVGHLSQIGGVQLLANEDGPARGVRLLEFRTGTGLVFKVGVERGLDVGYCEYRGHSLAWIPPTKLPGPWYFEQPDGFGWLRSALGGFNNTCGLLHIGNPEEADVSHYNFPARPRDRYGVHDRAAMLPGQLLSYGERWDGDECLIEAVGETVQAQAYGENLRLTRRYTCRLGESRFSMHDLVENAGYLRTSHMYLYHLNIGFPFVDAGSELVAPFAPDRAPRVLFGNVSRPDEFRTFIAPTQNWVQQTFQHSMRAEPDGRVPVAIINPALNGGAGLGLYVVYRRDQMPNYIEWRMMGEGQYAVGIEPCTSGFGREAVEAAGDMIWLEPGDRREYDLEVGILDGAQEIQAFRQRVAAIVKDRDLPMTSDTFGHTPARQALELGDVYGLAFDEARASRPPVRLGLVGAGGVVQSKHLPAIWRLRTQWEPVTVEAIVEPNAPVGHKVAGLYGCRWYPDLPAMLAAETLDALIVATPDDQHYPSALAGLEANLHVLVEKPITRSLAQAEHLCRLAEARNRLLVTVANKRYSPPYRRARQLITDGPVSDPSLFVGKFNLGYDYVWLLESGTIHLFDLARYLMGPVARLQAVGVNKYHRNRLGYPLENVAATLEFASGAVGALTTSATALSFKPWERVEVYANKRWLAVEDQYELVLYDDEEGPAKLWRPAMPNTLLFDEEFGGYTGMIENFLQAVRGLAAPAATGWDGYHAYELNVATHLSILRRQPVDLPLAAGEADAELAAGLKDVVKIVAYETFMANAGLRNYLFIRLTTDTGLTGVGEASLEWQEKTVETLCHEWVKGRVLGCDPFNIEAVVGGLIRDQYQGGATIMTAISGTEIALWDIVGKACGQPIYRLLGGRCHEKLPAYANGWYGHAHTPQEFAGQAQAAVARGYRALKFDPFGVAWKDLSPEQAEAATAIVAAVRQAVGPRVGLMIEFHGRLSAGAAIDMLSRLAPLVPVWCEEPVAPENLELLAEVKRSTPIALSAGERLYTLADFYRLTSLRAADVVQMDVAHCGGILVSKKIAALAAVQDLRIAPHCSVGPVALAASLHVDASTPNFMIQEAFGEFDVPWRENLVRGWTPLQNGEFVMSDRPGLGLELNEAEIAAHPYVQNPFPSLWDEGWLTNFKQS